MVGPPVAEADRAVAVAGDLSGVPASSAPIEPGTLPAPIPEQRWRAFLYLAGTALQMLLAAVITPVVTRLLGPAPFGRVAAGMAVMQVLLCLEALGLAVGVQRSYADGPLGPRRSRSVQSLACGSALLMSAVLYLTAGAWAGALGFDGAMAELRITIVWGAGAAMTSVFLARLRSADRVVAFCAVAIVQGPVAVVIALTGVAIGPASAVTYLDGMVAGQTLALVIALATSPPALGDLADRRSVRALLAFSLPLVPAQLATFVLNTSDRFVVQHHLGPVAVARYSLAYNLSSVGATLVFMLNNVYLPSVFSATPGPERAQVLARVRDQMLRLGLPATLGLALGAPSVLLVWAPGSFRPATLVGVATLITASTVPTVVYAAEFRSLIASGRSIAVALITGGAATLNVGLNLLLVGPMGIDGAALATLIAFVALAAVSHLIARGSPPLPPVRNTLLAWSAGACALTGASLVVPVTGPWVWVRLGLGGACLVPLLSAARQGAMPERSLRAGALTPLHPTVAAGPPQQPAR